MSMQDPVGTHMNLLRVQLEVGEHALQAWVARTEGERALGLQHRQDLPDGEGMLFICDQAAFLSFWMKNTPLPLSAAFVAEDGTIVQITDLEPHSLEPQRCPSPVRYVLEVNQGWFEEKGVAPGMRLAGPPFVK